MGGPSRIRPTLLNFCFSASRFLPSQSLDALLYSLHESILKAYLLSRGWKLRKIHDLGALVAEAVDLDPSFAPLKTSLIA